MTASYPDTINPLPFMVGETIPGYCCGHFDLDTMDQELRVEAVGADWVLVRGPDNRISLYTGEHADLRECVYHQLRDRAARDS